MKNVVIIGTGLAGYTVAREYRKLDTESRLTLFSVDDGAFYSKPMLSNAFAQSKTAQTLVNFRADQMASQLNATVNAATPVTQIDPFARILRSSAGETHFDQLVLALGARPISLPASGDGLEQVLTVNSLADYARFRGAIDGSREVTLVGGGLIGCEFANDLARGGYKVTLLHLGNTLLDSLVPADVGEGLQEKLVGLGINVITGTSATAINRGGPGRLIVTLRDGRSIETDQVLSAIGLVPAKDLAAAAGIRCNKGVAANQYLETSADGVYALGDCAEVEGAWLPYVMPIMNQARALAKTLAGEKTAVVYPIMPVVVKTPAYPVVAVPPPTRNGEWQIERDSDGAKALFLDNSGHLRGFALGGRFTAEKAALVKALSA